MKLSSLIVSTCAAAAILAAQTPLGPATPQHTPAPAATPVPAAPITPDTVVVTVEGKSYTAKQIDEMMKALPPQAKTMIDRNPQAGLTQLFILDSLSALAKQKKLDQVSPNKESLESKQRQYLANVVVQDENTHIHVTEAEQQAYYDAHKDMFQSVKISAIYIAFTPHPKAGLDGKMPQTEAEAKAKADDLVKQLRAGADFAKLATEHSEDKESAKKGGEYATIRRSDNYPAAIKDAIFKLKGDEVSDPVKQPAGFYIFKVTERNQQEFKDVSKTVFERVRQEKFSDWLKGMQKELAPKIDTPEYFKGPEPATGSATSIGTLPMPVSPDTVVATVSGKPVTAKQLDEYEKLLPPQGRAAMKQNPEAGLMQLFLIIQLSDEARKRNLDKESPNKEALELMDREVLAQAYVNEERNQATVTPAEEEAYYKKHSEEFESAKVNAILIAFSPNPKPASDGKTPRSEAEAKAKADDLVKQLRAGGDFAKLATENSDDKNSAAKGGEYPSIKRNAPYPQSTKDAVFALKPGEITDPVRQPSGFYIFKLIAKESEPLPAAAPQISARLKQEKFQEWITGLQKQYKPTIEKPDYFKK